MTSELLFTSSVMIITYLSAPIISLTATMSFAYPKSSMAAISLTTKILIESALILFDRRFSSRFFGVSIMI